jgi:hypothetical protein
MSHISKNGVGLATLLVVVFGYFGVELELQSVVDFLAAAGLVVSTGLAVYNQITRADVKWFFWKK